MGTSALGIREKLIISIPAELLGPLGWKAAELGFSFLPSPSLVCAVPVQPRGIPALEDGWIL